MIPTPPPGFQIPSRTTNDWIDKMSQHGSGLRQYDPRAAWMKGAAAQRDGELALCRDLPYALWHDHGRRTVFVDGHAMDLCANTDVAGHVAPTDLRLPYPAWLFWFQKPTTAGNCYAFCAVKNDTLMISMARNFAKEDGGVAAAVLACDITVDRTFNEGVEDVTPSGERQCNEVPDLLQVIGMILLMQSYPEYVTRHETKYKPRGGKAVKHQAARLTVPVRLTQRVEVGSQPPGGGTHASPRTHWRRAHWRRQPHGVAWAIEHPDFRPIIDEHGRTCHMKRIESFLVGAAPAPEQEAAHA